MTMKKRYVQWSDQTRDRAALLFLCVALCCVALSQSGLFRMFSEETSINQLIVQGLTEKTQEENARLPIMLDASTRLDRVDSQGMEYIYHLSVLGDAGARFVDDVIAGRLQAKHQSAKWSMCESSDIAPLLKAGIRLTYQYSVSGIANIAAVTLDKSDCV